MPSQRQPNKSTVLLGGLSAQLVANLREAPLFQALGCFAAAAAVGLLGVTLVALARLLGAAHPSLLPMVAAVFGVGRLGAHPAILVGVAAVLGGLATLLGWDP